MHADDCGASADCSVSYAHEETLFSKCSLLRSEINSEPMARLAQGLTEKDLFDIFSELEDRCGLLLTYRKHFQA